MSQKKQEQLKMPIGTASNKLKKLILFQYVTEANHNICYRCGTIIENIDEFSIEHKVPYLDSEDPSKLFFDLDNIAFSHKLCNIKARRTRPTSKLSNKSESIFVGVHFNKTGKRVKRWYAVATINGKSKKKCCFDNQEDAYKAYLELINGG